MPNQNSQLDNGLIEAVQNGDISAAEDYIQKGADVNKKDQYGKTALMWAVGLGHIDIVKLLIKHKVDLDVTGEYGRTVLMDALESDYTDIANLLIQKGADVNKKDQYGKTALMHAAKKGYTDIVKLLLEKYKVDVNAKGYDTWTALMYATRFRHTDIEEILKIWENLYKLINEEHFHVNKPIKLSDIINKVDNKGKTLLMYSLEKNMNNEAKYLIENGANVNLKDKQGKGILTYIVENGDVHVLELATKTKKLSNDEVLQLMFLSKRIKDFNDLNDDQKELLSKEYEIAKESVANIANSIDLSTQDSIRQIREAKNISNTMKKFLESQKVNVGKRKLAEDSKRAVKRAKIETKNMEKELYKDGNSHNREI